MVHTIKSSVIIICRVNWYVEDVYEIGMVTFRTSEMFIESA